MTPNNVLIERCILEFKDWLSGNRSELNDILRRYRAIKYYLTTLSIGFLIFAGNSPIMDSNRAAWKALIIVTMIYLVLLSSKIAFHISGAGRLRTLSVVGLETNTCWFKDIHLIVGSKSPLLKDAYVAKTMRNSTNNRFELSTFMTSMILVADALVDVKNNAQVAMPP